MSSYDLPHGVLMNQKVLPAYNGRDHWMPFEELLLDWEDMTTLEKPAAYPIPTKGFDIFV